MSRAQTTTDHQEIRHWIEARGGHPAAVQATMREGDPGILRVDFDPPDDSLRQIAWDDFFATFEERGLAFLYQDTVENGKPSRFFKFVNRHGEEQDADEDEGNRRQRH